MISRREEQPRFDTFDVVVRDICAYLNDPDASKKYGMVARFLRRSLEELNVSMIGNIKSVLLLIEDNLTAPLPDDFNYVSKIGVCCNGQLRILPQNEKLCVPESPNMWICCTCTEPSSMTSTQVAQTQNPQGCSHCTFHNVIAPTGGAFNNTTWGNGLFAYPYWYGVHAKNYNGSYKIDDQNGQVIFGSGCDTAPGSMVVMEYNAALGNSDYAFIPRTYFNVLLHKTAYYIKKGQEQILENRNFIRQWKMLKRTVCNFTLEELVQSIRSGFSSAPRR